MHLQVNGHKAWVQRAGTVGPRVLLIMGFGMSGDAWTMQVRDLQRDHQVAWYDVRGLGHSDVGDGKLTLPDLADDAAAVLDALGWRTAHVVGVSMGGMIAQLVAAQHPDRVASLSLITTHAGGGLHRTFPHPSGALGFAASNLTTGLPRLLSLGFLLFPRRALPTLPLSLNELGSLTASAPAAVRTAHVRAIHRFDVRPHLPQLQQTPVLLVRAGRDKLVPARCMDELLDLLPHATLLDLPYAGHGAILHAADAINAGLRTHVRTVSDLALA